MAAAQNNLLASLLAEDLEFLEPFLSRVTFPRDARLYEPGDSIEQCYLPCGSAIAGYFIVMEDGAAIETAMVGREGALGGIVSYGRLPAFARSSVFHEGTFLKISLRELDRAKSERPSIARLFNRYADCFVAQIFQSVACNAAHTIEQRAARWLSAAVERTGSTSVVLTQEQLGSLLGVGRTYVSRVLQRLKSAGMITIHRGGLEVRHAEALRSIACSCNDRIEQHFDEVLRGVYPD